MDDDSLPAPDMVPRLLAALAAHPQAAAVGACHVDPRRETGRTPFSVVAGGRLRWLECSDLRQVWEVDHVIASGCLIPATALQAVGWMREDFFIDWVDTEWCLRARDRGYRIYGVCAALLVTGWYGCWGGKSPIMHRGGITIRHAISCSCYAHAEWVGCLNFIWCFVS
jgi:rhamnosyltransferase